MLRASKRMLLLTLKTMESYFPQQLLETIQKAQNLPIPSERKRELEVLISYVLKKIHQGKIPQLNFICTHNSRRSQFSQVWSKTSAFLHGLQVETFSGGIEETAFNERAVDSLKRQGFLVKIKSNGQNPQYEIIYSQSALPLLTFSKIYNHPPNPEKEFATIMVCDHADENCPVIPSAEKRILLRYEDPKKYDGTPLEASKYDERSLQIASEMLFVFSKVKSQIDGI